MAGLLDQYEQRGNSQAMDVLIKLAEYLHKRISKLKATKGEAWWAECLTVEFGGMNEVSYSLFHITGDQTHKDLGDWFYKGAFMDPLARGQDSLNGNHANCHLREPRNSQLATKSYFHCHCHGHCHCTLPLYTVDRSILLDCC